jgi:arginine decarboxylase
MRGLEMTATKIFLTKGVGRHKEKLTSFESALRNAKIAEFNLVRVSSIFPPRCKLISRDQGLKELNPGQIVFCVLSENSTNEPHRLVAASIGLAIPKDRDRYGYLAEHKTFGQKGIDAGDYAEDLAASMLSTSLGVEFDPDASYDEKKEIWKINGQIVRSQNVTQTAIGDKRGFWTTVIAGAIFLL